jgi:hypothetical protein
MSKESAREADPLIADPEMEKDRIVAEGIEAALLSSIQAQAADPNGPYQPDDLAYIAEQVASNKMTLPKAIMSAQKRAHERQAEMAPAGAPETQPGLSAPGMGMEQPAGPPAGPPNMDAMLAQLGGGAGSSAQPQSPGGVMALANSLGGA